MDKVKPAGWVAVDKDLPVEGLLVLLCHRDGSQWVGYRGVERASGEDIFAFTPFDYFIDRGEHEQWEWGDITHWRILPAPPEQETDPGTPPYTGKWRVVDTDNFGGDYPDEKVVGEPYDTEAEAQAFADKENDKWGEFASRWLKVVRDGYVLQPGFEP